MNSPLVTHALTKRFGRGGPAALNSLTLEISPGRVVGLLGRNGAGKSTLLHVACGLLLPTSGTCVTLGHPCGELDAPELSRIGFMPQENAFLAWMTGRQQLDFNASFYPAWDPAREQRLLTDLELDPSRKIGQLSVGDQQKLGLMLAVCHRPQVLLLDEPMSALDPIVRKRLMAFVVDLVREDGSTIVLSSHILADVEKIVDWVVVLDRGELALDSALDDVQETYAEWIVTAAGDTLPARFTEPWVLAREGDARQARLCVRTPGDVAEHAFATAHGATIARRAMNLEQLFPVLINERRPAA
ncbi:MAG: ABC transporter ATP-binding protein [Opitutus sp.]|nr:ABC transporter ATP-binding protein [Opitutus sp.]